MKLSPRFLVGCLLLSSATSAVPLVGQTVVRYGLQAEWVGTTGLSRSGDLPLTLQDKDTWADTVQQRSLTVLDTDDAVDLQVVAATVGSRAALELTGPTANSGVQGAPLRDPANAEGQAVSIEIWLRTGDLSEERIIWETGRGTFGKSLTIRWCCVRQALQKMNLAWSGVLFCC